MIQDIPKNHPRYHSLQMRKKLSDAMKKGLVHETGLIAHGRGEAFDYMLGEQTIDSADQAEKVAAAALLLAKKPVISVNGNVVALVAEDCINLAKQVSALIEVNLFHRTKKRITGLVEEMKQYDDVNILGADASVRIPGLSHDRGWCEKDGIFSADVILVPLEDGDRCQALKKMGKTVITIDLNPLSRTAKTADITIVDNVIRALPRVISWVHQLKSGNKIILNDLVEQWDNQKTLIDACQFMSQKLNQMD